MKVLLAALGSAGDVFPVVGIGAELRARGHDVLVVTNPWFEATIRGEGLGFAPMGTADEYRRTSANPDLWNPRKAFAVVVRDGVVPAQGIVYDAIAKTKPDVVAATSLCLGARTARDKLGVPLVTLHMQPSILRSVEAPPYFPELPMPAWYPRFVVKGLFRLSDFLVIDPAIGPPLTEHRRSLGLPPVKRPFEAWIHSPDLVLGLFPDWFAAPPSDWPRVFETTGFVGYDGGAAAADRLDPHVESFLAAGSTPVVITPGSANVHGREFFAAAMAACVALGRRALLLTPHEEQLPHTLPAGMAHAKYLPFSAVLPRAAAFVHHGGIGSLSQGLAAGVPQLLMPMAHDQPDNAVRAERLGVAAWIPARRWKAAAIAPALDRLLGDPEVSEACRSLAPRVAFAASRRQAANAILRVAR
ncbi:MAG TPA: nucleotide disphospho-sugar-binding domain-containing protein [Candidatus Polarisedimenticolaceae bacterium]